MNNDQFFPSDLNLADPDSRTARGPVTVRGVYKALGFIVLIATSVLIAALGRGFLRRPAAKRNFSILLANLASRWIMHWMGLEAEVLGWAGRPQKAGPYLLVSNHVSSLDALILSSVLPMVFISSVEVRESVIEGTIASMGGSLFSERRDKRGLLNEVREVAVLLREGFPILLFAEATSSNGEAVLPFKNAFFQSAIDAGATLQPVWLQYTEVAGEPVRRDNRDQIFYYGTMNFVEHLLRACSAGSILARLQFLPEIKPRQGEDRKELSGRVFEAISGQSKPR